MSYATTVFPGVRAGANTLPTVNRQSIPIQGLHHFDPLVLAPATLQLSPIQILSGCLRATMTAGATTTWTMPTAQNLLQALSGNAFKVNVGDVFTCKCINNSLTGAFVINTASITGATGGFSLGTGLPSATLNGNSCDLNIQWLSVSADGNTGVYQIYGQRLGDQTNTY